MTELICKECGHSASEHGGSKCNHVDTEQDGDRVVVKVCMCALGYWDIMMGDDWVAK